MLENCLNEDVVASNPFVGPNLTWERSKNSESALSRPGPR
jgi:hypothetical protein